MAEKRFIRFTFERDPDSASPLYMQVANFLAGAIRSGGIAVGSLLPSERLYARTLGVSRTTVTDAYHELKAMGLVRASVGRGAVVIADDAERQSAGSISWPSLLSRLARPALALEAADAITIGLGNGFLHTSLTPRAALTRCAARVLRDVASFDRPAPILGLPQLREALIVGPLRAASVRATVDDVLVTGGAQQGLNVLARTLLAPGDVVLCETPTWHGAFRAFGAAGAETIGVGMDREGVEPDALEDALFRHRPKFVYLIPSFQCPTGRTMGLERRRRVLEICTRARTPIVESHVYGDLFYGERMPSLKSLDEADIVVQMGSASKTVNADLRLGWLVAPRGAIEALAAAKATFDLSTPSFGQRVLAELFASGEYDSHVAHLRTQLRARRDALIASLARDCPDLRFATPTGGLYLWARLPDRFAAHDVERAALSARVAIRAGDAFLPGRGPSNYIRLCYAAPAMDEIELGTKRLGEALRALDGKRGTVDARIAAFAEV